MTSLAKSLRFVRKNETGRYDVVIDGAEFPWHIARDHIQAEDMSAGIGKPVYRVWLPVLVDGVPEGVDEVNDLLAEEADASRVYNADQQAMPYEQGGWLPAGRTAVNLTARPDPILTPSETDQWIRRSQP